MNNSFVNIKSKDIFLSFIIFALLYLTSGFANIFSNTSVLVLLSIIGFVLIITNKFYMSLKNDTVILILLIFFNVSITTILMGDEIKQLLLWIVYLFVSIAIVATVKGDRLLKCYVRTIYFLCIAALALWLTYLLAPSLVQRLPVVTNQNNRSAYTIIVATIYKAGNVEIARNQGIFWEPGAFQTFINIALIITLFYNNLKINKKRYAFVFILTIITTFSTAGYLVMTLIIITYIIYCMSSKGVTRAEIKLALVLMIGIFAFLLAYQNMPDNIKYQLFGKVTAYFDGVNDADSSSTGTRLNSVVMSFKAFLSSPIFGCGVNNMGTITEQFGSSIGTCTPINWFSYYGIMIGIAMNVGLLKFSKQFGTNKLVSILLFVSIIISISSENYWRNSSILIFVLLGYQGFNDEKGKENEDAYFANQYI